MTRNKQALLLGIIFFIGIMSWLRILSDSWKSAQTSSLNCVFPRHVFVGGSAYAFCEGPIPNGPISVAWDSHSYGRAGDIQNTNLRFDGTKCQTRTRCFRFPYKGLKPTPSDMGDRVTVWIERNGTEYSYSGTIGVKKDCFQVC
jgi:hypothetical protein